MNQLKAKYQKEYREALAKKLNLSNAMACPQIKKINVNIGVGDSIEDKSRFEEAKSDLEAITGQKPKVCKAKQAISTFKVRQGDPIGLTVTLRGERMFDFLEKLVKIVLPRVKDFQGVPKNNFDGKGNYSLGITEQVVFPEVDYEKVKRVRGLSITIVTNARTDEQALALLEILGMPFEKPAVNKKNAGKTK